MEVGRSDRVPARQQVRVSQLQLGAQVPPFVIALADGDADRRAAGRSVEFRRVEAIAPRPGFVVDRLQVYIDGGDRIGLCLEALELRMLPIAAGLPAQHLAGEQGFAPQRDQADGIEVARVQGPDAHDVPPCRRVGSVAETTARMEPDRRRARIAPMIALLIAAAAAAAPAPDAAPAPPAKIGLCVACHGTDGRSRMPAAPHIGGQNEAYLVWALNQYREGRREGDVMGSVIGVLSRRDIEALADWYARQTWPALDAAPAEDAP